MNCIIKISGLLIFILHGNLCAIAQNISRYNTFSYNVNEGMLQSTIADMVVDQNNFCWISYPNGIQKFDGTGFTEVPVQDGLPDDKQANFLKTLAGEMFVSHSKGISKYHIQSNRFSLVYKNHAGINNSASFIGEDGNIIYFFLANGIITGMHAKTYKIISQAKAPWADRSSNIWPQPKFSNNIINHKVSILMDYEMYLWDLVQGKLLAKKAIGKNLSPFFLTMKNEDEVFYYTYNPKNNIALYNFNTGTTQSFDFQKKIIKPISRCIIFPWQDKMLVSVSEHLYETDSSLNTLHSELVNFQNQPVSQKSSIHKMVEDNFGNLYLATVSDGIRKIMRNNYPLKFYHAPGLKSNFILSVLPDKKNNRIVIGTFDNGLLVFDSLQQLIKHIPKINGNSFSPNTILKKPDGDYAVFSANSMKVYTFKPDFSLIAGLPISSKQNGIIKQPDYFCTPLFQNDTLAIVQSQGKLLKMHFKKNAAMIHEFTNAYTMSGLYHNGMIISHANDQLFFLDAESFAEIKRVSFYNTGGVRCFAKKPAGIPGPGTRIYMGSNKGIFVIDINGKLIQHITKKEGLPDECIYAMEFDDEGLLWCSTNKGICKISENGNVLHLKKEDGLQENEFNTNVVAKSPDGEMYFGGVNGVSSFYPSAINTFKEEIQILVNKIKINQVDIGKDTAVWKLEDLNLPYDENAFSIDFLALANNNPGQYIHQYKMEGIDKAWVQNNGLQTVRYLLPPGKYIFSMYASRFFNEHAQPMKQITIHIHPPYWKTWWFRTLAGLALLGIMAFIINQVTRRKYQRKLAVLESEQKIQLERERISRDLHDNIGAYANAVLYKTELLEHESNANSRIGLMKDLRFASKDIIASLRETIWALKKDEYTSAECNIRIRNFIQPLTRYYPHIQFSLNNPPEAEFKLWHTHALNLVRIVQEAIANSIKHGDVKNISITNLEKNNNWFIEIKDDGKGFSSLQEDDDTDESNGLKNMKQRATTSGFDLQIQSIPGTGTTVWIKI